MSDEKKLRRVSVFLGDDALEEVARAALAQGFSELADYYRWLHHRHMGKRVDALKAEANPIDVEHGAIEATLRRAFWGRKDPEFVDTAVMDERK